MVSKVTEPILACAKMPYPPRVEHARPASRRRWLLVGLLLALLGGGTVLVLRGVFRQASPPPVVKADDDPPLAKFSSPFLNTQAGVKYVGDVACAGCHGKLTRSYHGHPMGRSVAPAFPGDGREHYPAQFAALHFQLTAQRRGEQVLHRLAYLDPSGKQLSAVPPAQVEIAFAIGSGSQGRTYLVDHDGYLFQSPISWYAHPGKWDLSPGYEKQFRGFNRPIVARCVFCHADGATPVEGTINRYRAPVVLRPIGCERCHGPGELHVAARKRGDDLGAVDPTIVNPRHLPTDLREAVCQQCHLQGEADVVRRGRSLWDYRPGLPLNAFVSIFVRPPESADAYKAVSHAEQMQVSECFTASKGKLGCISCHNPHEEPAPAQRVSYFRKACLSCHGEVDCHLPLAQRRTKQRDDSCIVCHMPRAASSNVVHAAITDHRILRHPTRTPVRENPKLRPGAVPLVDFHRDLVRDDPELPRDLGLALIEKAQNLVSDDIRRTIAKQALPLLNAAVERAPGDADAWEGQGYALRLLDRQAEALVAAEKALARDPRQEAALEDAAHADFKLGRLDAALAHARRLIAVNPWNADYHAFLARIHGGRKDWPACLAACRQALTLDPANVAARSLLVSYHLAQGERQAARAEFATLMSLDPPDKEARHRWFERVSR
jgi:predicted CXXCH cytochrome family protein